jgi:hypothetical protein
VFKTTSGDEKRAVLCLASFTFSRKTLRALVLRFACIYCDFRVRPVADISLSELLLHKNDGDRSHTPKRGISAFS